MYVYNVRWPKKNQNKTPKSIKKKAIIAKRIAIVESVGRFIGV